MKKQLYFTLALIMGLFSSQANALIRITWGSLEGQVFASPSAFVSKYTGVCHLQNGLYYKPESIRYTTTTITLQGPSYSNSNCSKVYSSYVNFNLSYSGYTCPEGTEFVEATNSCEAPPQVLCEDRKAQNAPGVGTVPDDGKAITATRYYCDASTMCKLIAKLTLLAALILPAITVPAFADDLPVFESTNTPIAEFVSWYSRQTGLKILLGQGVTGSVSFTAPNLLPAEYPDFFDSVLRSHGYVIEKDGGAYVIKVSPEAVQPITPSVVRLYRFNYVRNTKVVDLIASALRATNTQMIKDKPLDNYMVQVLPSTNAIIVSGTPDQLAEIEVIINGIDVRQRQVFIEAVITETELGGSQEIGLNLQAAFDNAGFVTNLVTASKLKDNLFIFEGGDFNALVKAVTTNKDTKLLSTPNILIMDRERGYLTVGQNVPFLVSSEVTSGGNAVQRIERKDVGVSLEVTPHVLGGDVVLVINQESSSVTDSTVATDIITNKRTLTTTVVVRDGQTIALGGLISTENRQIESGVPGLKDVPLIGALFKSNSTNHVQKELKVILKTTIL
ncbi:secretin N-terminal domain-containing protein [Vibrio fluvialis]